MFGLSFEVAALPAGYALGKEASSFAHPCHLTESHFPQPQKRGMLLSTAFTLCLWGSDQGLEIVSTQNESQVVTAASSAATHPVQIPAALLPTERDQVKLSLSCASVSPFCKMEVECVHYAARSSAG